MTTPIGDPRPARTAGAAGDQRPARTEGPAGDPRPARVEKLDDAAPKGK